MKKMLFGILLFGCLAVLFSGCQSMKKNQYYKAMEKEDLGICPHCNQEIPLSGYLSNKDFVRCSRCLKSVRAGVLKTYYQEVQTQQYEASIKK